MSPCATPEQLEKFLRDGLHDHDLETIVDHLEECTACQQLLDQITVASDPDRRLLSETDRDPDPEPGEEEAHLLDRLKAGGPRQISLSFHDVISLAGDRSDSCLQETDLKASASAMGPAPTHPRYPSIHGFRIIREVGRGGMGVVYEAEEERLSRRVALKVLPASLLVEPKLVQRFEREARAAARLHHTNIVPVFGSGHQEGHHYYFMQYIEGRGFDAVLNELRRLRTDPSSAAPTEEMSALTERDRLTYRSLARIGLQVAEALDHAHGQGVLHRDIKPSNLLLGTRGNVWVTDFGLAKTLEAEDLTSTGDVLGTIRYMAPERFAGRCDARSDLYSVGLTLHELAALRPAFEAPDRYTLIERMRKESPTSLRKLDPRFPRDLETIIQTLVDREPARRYATAAALADDLRRFLEDRPIQARPASTPERVVLWCRRNPWVASFLLALMLGVIGSTWQAIRATASERAARRAENTAQRERDRAETSRNRAVASIAELLFQDSGDKTRIAEETRSYRKGLVDAGLRESQELVRELETDGRARALLVMAYDNLSRAQIEGGERAAAIATIQKAIALAQALFDQDHAIDAGRGLGSVLLQLGGIATERETSLSALRQSTAVFQTLLAEHPDGDRAEWFQMIALNHCSIGHRESGEGRWPEAIEALGAARATWKALLDEFGATLERSKRQADTELYLCRAYLGVRRFDDAFSAGQRAIESYRTIVHDHPDDFGSTWQLGLAHHEMAFAHNAAGKTDEAIHDFEEARQTLKQMTSSQGRLVSRMAQILGQLAQVDYNLRSATDADVVRYAGPRRAAISEAYEICDKLGYIQPLSRELRWVYADSCVLMSFYQEEDGGQPDLALLRKSEQLWEELRREEPAGMVPRAFLVIIRRKLADQLSAQGEREEASRWRSQSLTTARGDPNLFCELALEYARMLGPIDRLPSKLPPRVLQDRRLRIVDDAIAMLREAVTDGFKDAKRLRDDPDFAPIRSTPECLAILSDLEFPTDPFTRP